MLRDVKELYQRYEQDRARFVMTIDPDTDAFWNGTYPFNPHPQPWAAQQPGDAIAMALALSEVLARQTAAELSLCRRVEAELNDSPVEEKPLTWNDLTHEERSLVPRVLVLARPGTASAEDMWIALTRRLPVTVALLDGEGIATADVSSPGGRLDALVLALARDGHPVAQGSIGAPGHLMQSVVDSLAGHGPALLRVYAPDPVTSGVAPERIAELARLAVETRTLPVYSMRGANLSLGGNPDPDREWAHGKLEVSEPSGTNYILNVTRTVADWAVMQSRFRRHFRVVSRGHRSDKTKNLSAYLALDARAREGIQPYVDVRDKHGRHAIALVSREMTALVERAASRWNDLREMAASGEKPSVAKEPPATATVAPAAAPAASTPAEAIQALTENLLRLSGYGTDDPFFKRSLREFVANERSSNGDAE
jgi:pyruvate-ferredoxin/flavodoxin oxidoreductase